MGKPFRRQEILNRLGKAIATGKPVLVACCGNGLIAKCAEMGGADIIMTACTSKSRLMGLPTTTLGDPNNDVLALFPEIDNVVKDTPIIGGIDALDPRFWDLSKLINRYLEAGYCGLINYPTIATYYGEEKRAVRESVGLGFSREVEMMRIAHQMDIFTMAYVFNVEDARQMVEAGVDCIVPHAGTTTGGTTSFKAKAKEEAVQMVNSIVAASKAINPRIIPLAHGGPFAGPEDTEYLYQNSDAVGFLGASSIERIPIERAVMDVVRRFKAVTTRKM